jgi:hypothetical protein
MATQDPPRLHASMILYAQLLEARNRARRWCFINLAIAVIGGLLSLGSYASASSGPEGGTYQPKGAWTPQGPRRGGFTAPSPNTRPDDPGGIAHASGKGVNWWRGRPSRSSGRTREMSWLAARAARKPVTGMGCTSCRAAREASRATGQPSGWPWVTQ